MPDPWHHLILGPHRSRAFVDAGWLAIPYSHERRAIHKQWALQFGLDRVSWSFYPDGTESLEQYLEALAVGAVSGLHLSTLRSEDESALNAERSLKILTLAEKSRSTIDLSQLPNLRLLEAHDEVQIASFGSGLGIKAADLRRQKRLGRDLSMLADWSSLEALSLAFGSTEAIDGIQKLKQLDFLDLAYLPKVKSISPLSNGKLPKLKVLKIEKCSNIHDFSTLSELKSLELLTLFYCGSMPSLQWVHELPNLRGLSFAGTDVLDGKIHQLRTHKTLQYVIGNNKRHYDDRAPWPQAPDGFWHP